MNFIIKSIPHFPFVCKCFSKIVFEKSRLHVGAIHESPIESAKFLYPPSAEGEKRKNIQNIFEKSSEHFSLQTPPILPLPQSPLPFFHQIAVKKVHARKTFFRIFKNFFRPKPSFFVFFKTFFRANADRVIPFHGEKARKTDNLHNPKFQKIPLVWAHFPCEKRTQKNIQIFQKNFKKGVDILERVCYTT